jgi:hypothetical protein
MYLCFNLKSCSFNQYNIWPTYLCNYDKNVNMHQYLLAKNGINYFIMMNGGT